jgi:anti-anti-sigma factor
MMVAFNIVDEPANRIVSVYGDIDAINAEAFERACSDSPTKRSIVDLRVCPYIDSTGLTALIRANRNSAVTLVLSPPSQIYRIFLLTDLINHFTIFDTVDEAVLSRRSDTRSTDPAFDIAAR